MKKCLSCGIEKDLSDFPKKDKNTYRGKCKICYNERKKELVNMSEEDKVIMLNNKKTYELRKKMEKEVIKNNKLEDKKRKLLYKEELKKIKKKKMCKLCGEENESMFYDNNMSKCKKCVSIESKYKTMSDVDKEIYKDNLKVWRNNNIIRVRVSGAKHRAVRKGIEFSITDEDIIEKLREQDDRCYISKVPLSFNENDWYGMSLDRVDSNKGYTKDNVIIVTKFVNTSKNTLSLEEYIKYTKEVCDNL